jgi:uncharacterized protein YdeI (YjbR/CyaY-like superfamily)
MEASKLSRKLLIKPAHRILLVNAPVNYPELLAPLPHDAKLISVPDGTFDVIQLFVTNKAELKRDLIWLQSHLRKETVFWITYPKKSSGIVSDLEMMQSWEETSLYGLSTVSAAAVNDTWTALRFRPAEQVKRSSTGKSETDNILAQFLDAGNRKIKLPSELHELLQANPAAISFFESLSFTNKKEYVSWVLTAKQEKTKTERIQKTAEKLLAGKKNPSEK